MRISTLFAPLLFFCLQGVAQLNPPVITSISGPDTVCTGIPSATHSYTANATNSPTSYTWGVYPSSNVSYNSAGNVLNVTFTGANGVYNIGVMASNTMGSSTLYYKQIHVYETPNVSFSGALAVCQGSSTMLMASSTMQSASGTLSYTWSPASSLNNPYSSSVIATPSANTTYTLDVLNVYCKNKFQITVNVSPTPSLSVTPDHNPMCKGEKALITLSGNATSYSVNGVASSMTFTIAPTGTQTLVVTGISQAGCQNTMNFTENVNLCLAIQEAKTALAGLIVYPNPSSGTVYVRSGENDVLRIYNQLGQEVRRMKLGAEHEEQISDLSNGAYFFITDRSRYKVIIAK